MGISDNIDNPMSSFHDISMIFFNENLFADKFVNNSDCETTSDKNVEIDDIISMDSYSIYLHVKYCIFSKMS